MLIPLGDNLEKRSLPFCGLIVIAANLLVGMYELRLWRDDYHSWLKRIEHRSQPEQRFHFGEHADPTAPLFRSPQLEEFVEEWALKPHEFEEGRTETLVSHMFMHADLWHFLGNMFTLWIFLSSVEAGMGGMLFLTMYLLSGLAGGALHCYMNPGSTVPMLGASGAISGVIGAYFVAFGALARIKMAWNGGFLTGWRWINFQLPAGMYVFFWLIIPQIAGMEAEAQGQQTGVAWFAHIGGMAAGGFIMLIFRGYVHSRLSYTRDGLIVVGESADLELERKQIASGQVTIAKPAADACTYCSTPLAEGLEMSDSLVRCGNPTCRRLNYLQTQQVSATR